MAIDLDENEILSKGYMRGSSKSPTSRACNGASRCLKQETFHERLNIGLRSLSHVPQCLILYFIDDITTTTWGYTIKLTDRFQPVRTLYLFERVRLVVLHMVSSVKNYHFKETSNVYKHDRDLVL